MIPYFNWYRKDDQSKLGTFSWKLQWRLFKKRKEMTLTEVIKQKKGRWRYQDVSSDESKTVTFVTATYLMTKKSQRLNRCWLADIGDHMCWWQVWDVDDRFNTLRKSHNILYIMKKVAKILIRPTTSDISHHHNDVTNITVTVSDYQTATSD